MRLARRKGIAGGCVGEGRSKGPSARARPPGLLRGDRYHAGLVAFSESVGFPLRETCVDTPSVKA
jgi:hypothetical protein